MAPRSGTRKYDVALSFAGEQRLYVNEVAAGLRHRGIRVFYDKYEEANLWGKDLYEHLHEIYGDAAEFCVIFASEAYREKVWATHERKSAQERALREHGEYVLPARFDNTKIPGIMETVGCIDLTTHTPEELVLLIVEKLGPIERKDFIPDDLSRLYAHLGTHGEEECAAVAQVARSFFSEFSELNADERRLVFTIFTRGCPGAMPENMHIHVEKIRRWLDIDPGDLSGILKRISPFGFRFQRYRDEDEFDDGDDEMVSINWIDLTVREGENELGPDEDFVMSVAVGIFDVMQEDYCDECVQGVIERCDFSPLGLVVEQLDS